MIEIHDWGPELYFPNSFFVDLTATKCLGSSDSSDPGLPGLQFLVPGSLSRRRFVESVDRTVSRRKYVCEQVCCSFDTYNDKTE